MPSMTDKDYYGVLDVSKDAETDEIRKAFQKKARTLHPDVNKEPDAEERFKEVSEAYAVLSDPEKRARYDAMRSGNPFAQGWSTTNTTTQPGAGWPFGADPFAGAWTSSAQKAHPYNPRAGSNIDFELQTTSKAAKEGFRRAITFNRYAVCDECSGKGTRQSAQATTCPTCNGTGRMTLDLRSLLGFGVMEMICPECEGSGRVVSDPCPSCSGTGRTLTGSEVVVEIPANSHDGDRIVVEGMGNAGTNGSSPGDFVCHVAIDEERLSMRQAGGLRLVGFALPFLAVGLLMGSVTSMLYVVALPLILGLFMTLSDGLPSVNAGWLRNAGRTIVRGATSGLYMALFMMMFMSCGRRW